MPAIDEPYDCPDPTQQSGAVLTVALTALRSGFNAAFPDRDKASDGWIGDSAHAERTSGHNPDDTAGVSAEYSDSDTKQEVRAIDVDKDLRTDGVDMQDVIDLILSTPEDTKRLKYIIFNETEWSKSNDWRPEPYYGSNPHTQHAHFSGDPAYDEDGSPWSVEMMGEAMYSEDKMRAFPWQYDGGGIGENDADTHRSTLSYFNEMLSLGRDVKASVDALSVAVPPDLIARLDAILAAASDDTQTDVVLPPDARAALDRVKALLMRLPQLGNRADYDLTA